MKRPAALKRPTTLGRGWPSRLTPGSAEEAISWMYWVIAGDGASDRGLMTRIHHGAQHIPTCQIGYCVVEGDSQRGGQPCAERCLRARTALALAETWLKAHEPPSQMEIEDVAG